MMKLVIEITVQGDPTKFMQALHELIMHWHEEEVLVIGDHSMISSANNHDVDDE